MTALPERKNRRLLPRWYTFARSADSGELASITRSNNSESMDEDPFFQHKISEWENQPSLGLAIDILSSAARHNRIREFERFGWWILTRKENIATSVLRLARAAATGTPRMLTTALEEDARQAVRALRKIAAEFPRDATIHTDLALAHTALGNMDKAARAIEVAVLLAPDSRFILRSASRFWVHAGMAERAHDTLLRSDRTKHDPWLTSAELAISSLTTRPPRFVKQAREQIGRSALRHFQTSEVAGALATIELLSGNRKKARDSFNHSLIDPTENAIAQAVWAAEKGIQINIHEQKITKTRAFEAIAWRSRQEMDWIKCAQYSEFWLNDEPFSSTPAILGSASAALCDSFEKSISLAERGLSANPLHPILFNNLLFAEILSGNAIKSTSMIDKYRSLSLDDREKIVYRATVGLFNFRFGSLDLARSAYTDAINMGAKDYRSLAAIAAGFWAREEQRIGSEYQTLAVEYFNKLSRGIRDPEIIFISSLIR